MKPHQTGRHLFCLFVIVFKLNTVFSSNSEPSVHLSIGLSMASHTQLHPSQGLCIQLASLRGIHTCKEKATPGSHRDATILTLLLIIGGDIQMNPGPVKYPCGICSAAVKQRDPAVCCDQCGNWVHNRCSGFSAHIYDQMKDTSGMWICPSCGMPSFSSSLFGSSSIISTSNSFSALDPDHCSSSNVPAFVPTRASTPNKSKNPKYKNPDKIKVLCINTNSVRGKSLLLDEVIFEQDPDIILCQETKLDPSVYNSELFPSSFMVFRKDRTLDGGGVCIAVKSSLLATECHDLQSDVEAVWIHLQTTDHKPVYICSFYRPPDKDTDYTECLRTPLEKLYDKHRASPPIVILAGDFNYPHINWEQHSAPSDREGGVLINLLDDFHLQQMISTPTRFSHTTSSLLDLVISSHPALVTDCTVGREFSDHCLLNFCISKRFPSSECRSRKIYLYSKGNYQGIRCDMKQFNNTFFQSSPERNSVNNNWLQFKSALHSSVARNVPSKLISSRNRRPPWLTTQVRRLIKRRDNLAKVAAKSGSYIDRNRYRKARNLASKEINSAYQSHLNQVIGNLNEDPRGFYRFIKARRTDSHGIPALKTANGIVSTDEDKAKSLNDYFASVFTIENKSTIPVILPSIYPDMPTFEVTSPGVCKLLSGLDPKKLLGADDISPRIMKEACIEISGILTFIFNQSLNSGVVPTAVSYTHLTLPTKRIV